MAAAGGRTDRQHAERDGRCPRPRRGVQERDRREGDDAEHAAGDVQAVGIQRRTARRAGRPPGRSRPSRRRRARRSRPARPTSAAAAAERAPGAPAGHRCVPRSPGRPAMNSVSEQQERGPPARSPGACPEEPHTDAQEAREQDEVREEGGRRRRRPHRISPSSTKSIRQENSRAAPQGSPCSRRRDGRRLGLGRQRGHPLTAAYPRVPRWGIISGIV